MKGRVITGLAAVAFLCCSVGTTSASTITSLYGDKDGFGINVLNGSGFGYNTIVSESGEEGFTDTWVYGDQSFVQTFDISSLGTLTQATLEIFTGGQGYQGLTKIYLDDILLGTLTDGDNVGPAYNYAFVDTFNLLPYLSYFLDGHITIRVDTFNVDSYDGWSLDYSKLTFSDDQPNPVPEPATVVLFGAGLIGLIGGARVRRKL